MSGTDRQILRLALPSIISNITVPLLGLVDVAIVGHMGSAVYIGAISIGSMIFNILYWVFGFLRMGTSGLTSQALGRRDLTAVTQLLVRALAVGLSVAVAILVLQVPLKYVALRILSPEPEIMRLASLYFNVCVWGAPAMLTLYALMGWYVGMQNTRFPMFISFTQNIINILASLTLVYGFGMKVEGVALGTLIAQYAGVAIAIFLLLRHYGRLRSHFRWEGLFVYVKMLDFFKVNSDIFIRTLCLVAVNLFFLAAGARQGAVVLAVNTLLTQLYILFSYVVDGFAFAGEAMSGKYLGAGNGRALRDTVRRVFFWGTAIAVAFTAAYALGGRHFLALLTDEAVVVDASAAFFPWAVAVPLAGVAAFVWDGIFIGVTATRSMLLSSAVATAVFFAVYLVFREPLGNHALWMAFVTYLLVRGITQTLLWQRIKKPAE
ncbi:MAG: MATE family efflux transporter [Prevotella sp.]|nr:MATE family efflux transporter [Prevotella sp.]